jgi:diguanylate cyclase
MNETNQWKAKYGQLLSEFERSKASSGQLEKLLLRVLIRLTVAARGLDPRFDHQLAEIAVLLRKGVFSDKVRSELDELSDTLIRTGKPGDENKDYLKGESKLLFSFLKSCMQTTEELAALLALEERVNRADIVDADALFGEILKLPLGIPALPDKSPEEPERKEAQAKAGLLRKLFARPAPKIGAEAGGKIDVDAVRERIGSLLDALEIPVSLVAEAENLRNQLRVNASPEDFLVTLNESIDFIVHVKSYVQGEQKALESFLSALTDKLSTLEKQAIGVSAITQASVKDSHNAHETFSSEVENLRTSTHGATDVDQLKNLVTSRLDVIVHHLSASREKELDRLQLTEKQLALLAGRLHELEDETQELRAKVRAERDLALRDALTGLPNRMAYEERIIVEVARWRRFLHPLSLLVWDVDFFKLINDRFGHQAGDKALAVIGQELASSVRATDFVARYGGEEFVMLLPGADAHAALGVADKIREKIKSRGFNSRGKPVEVTVSCGISAFTYGDTPEEVFERADRALYQAKEQGRNRCIVL